MLIAGSQIVGHFQLWTCIFSKFHLKMDYNLVRYLRMRDSNKGKRQRKQNTIDYKAGRIRNRYKKFAEAHRSQLEDVKTGATYESWVAVKNTKRALKEAPKRNPEGPLPSQWKCPYYHPK